MMRIRFRFSFGLAFALAAALVAGPAAATWSLDAARSHLAFVTIKAKDIGEVNTFTEITGSVADDGQAKITMMLDSVETLIPIRNERMREFLFKTADYADATLTAKLDPTMIAQMKPGDIRDVVAEGMLTLHGVTQPMIISMQVAKVADNTLMAASTKPLMIDAAKFGLSDGVEKLREIAGLDEISNAVPVSFVMTFIEDPPETTAETAPAN